MSVFKYIAKRAIIPGHTATVEYAIEIGIQPPLASRRAPNKARNQAIGGDPETIYLRVDRSWDLLTVPFDRADLPQWEEFFASVEGGELFTFDAWGTVAVPDNPVTVEMPRADFLPVADGVFFYTLRLPLREI